MTLHSIPWNFPESVIPITGDFFFSWFANHFAYHVRFPTCLSVCFYKSKIVLQACHWHVQRTAIWCIPKWRVTYYFIRCVLQNVWLSWLSSLILYPSNQQFTHHLLRTHGCGDRPTENNFHGGEVRKEGTHLFNLTKRSLYYCALYFVRKRGILCCKIVRLSDHHHFPPNPFVSSFFATIHHPSSFCVSTLLLHQTIIIIFIILLHCWWWMNAARKLK